METAATTSELHNSDVNSNNDIPGSSTGLVIGIPESVTYFVIVKFKLFRTMYEQAEYRKKQKAVTPIPKIKTFPIFEKNAFLRMLKPEL